MPTPRHPKTFEWQFDPVFIYWNEREKILDRVDKAILLRRVKEIEILNRRLTRADYRFAITRPRTLAGVSQKIRWAAGCAWGSDKCVPQLERALEIALERMANRKIMLRPLIIAAAHSCICFGKDDVITICIKSVIEAFRIDKIPPILPPKKEILRRQGAR